MTNTTARRGAEILIWLIVWLFTARWWGDLLEWDSAAGLAIGLNTLIIALLAIITLLADALHAARLAARPPEWDPEPAAE